MAIRAFRPEDAPALAALARGCARGETDFVLNPLWETEADLFAEFERHGIDPADHLRVADSGAGVEGCIGFVRRPGATAAGLVCPIVAREVRGRGLGGELLRAALAYGPDELGVKLLSAAIGVRNRAGYSLLAAHGFRPARQHFLMRLAAPPGAVRPPIEDLVLETAGPGDADAIGALYAACGFEPRSPDALRAVLGDGKHAHAVARHAGRVVAFAEIETHWPLRPWVAFVGVASELRDRGVGSALVAFALARQFAAGARSALLLLSPGNRTAVRAYEKVGFRRHRVVDVLERGL
jgi:ribosomal protein S18 acetylase RimI-like enzyme